MNFQEPEVMELGEAQELIQLTFYPGEEEGPEGFKMRNSFAIYVEAE